MSGTWARVSKAAALDTRLSPAVVRVLLVLACYADDDGRCFPSVATIADRIGLTRRMIQLHLRRLEKLGYVATIRRTRPAEGSGLRKNGRRIGGGWTSNAYQLLFPAAPSLAAKPIDDAKPDFTSSEDQRCEI
jgi:hypothetical protein